MTVDQDAKNMNNAQSDQLADVEHKASSVGLNMAGSSIDIVIMTEWCSSKSDSCSSTTPSSSAPYPAGAITAQHLSFAASEMSGRQSLRQEFVKTLLLQAQLREVLLPPSRLPY